MITEVKQFFQEFIKAEQNAWNEYDNPDLEFRNQLVDKMYSFCFHEMKNSMGIIHEEEPSTPEDYENSDRNQNPREVFKISHYKNQELGDVFLIYTSVQGPHSFYKKIVECFFVSKINTEFNIIARYFLYDDRCGNIAWNESRALNGISFENAGHLVSIERYQEPVESEFSMKEYLADK
jgi:hypothetical protein